MYEHEYLAKKFRPNTNIWLFEYYSLFEWYLNTELFVHPA